MVSYMLLYQEVFLKLPQKSFKEGHLEGQEGIFTKNVVYKEILLSQN